jgi:hypothetical protein
MSSLIITSKSAVSSYVCARRPFAKATVQVVTREIVLPLLPVLVVAQLPTVRTMHGLRTLPVLSLADSREALMAIRALRMRARMTHNEARALVRGW